MRYAPFIVAIAIFLFAPGCTGDDIDDSAEYPPCNRICATKELYGFGPGGTTRCLCEGTGAIRTGPDNCSCGQCYVRELGIIRGYGYDADGNCPFNGADCLKCTRSEDTPTPEPETTAPPTSTPPPTEATPTPSDPTSAPTVPNTSSEKKSDDDDEENKGMAMWQIILVICSCILVFIVAVVALLSCYCKARQRLDEQENADEDLHFYNHQYAFGHGPGHEHDGHGHSVNSSFVSHQSFNGRPSSAKSLNPSYGDSSSLFIGSGTNVAGSFKTSSGNSSSLDAYGPASRRRGSGNGVFIGDEPSVLHRRGSLNGEDGGGYAAPHDSRPSSMKMSHTFGETTYGPAPSSLSRPASASRPGDSYMRTDGATTGSSTGRSSRLSTGSASEAGATAFTIGSGPLTPGALGVSHEFSRRPEPVEL